MIPSNINLKGLSHTIRDTVSGYRTLAEKAVNNETHRTGVVAALEQFFYKLDFLLKYGHLPFSEDVNRERLPSELQGLKDFLKKSSGKVGDSYVLQRNDTERYRFSQQGDNKVAVALERFHPAPATALSGYTEESWRLCSKSRVWKTDVLHLLLETEVVRNKLSYNDFCQKYNTNTLLPGNTHYSLIEETFPASSNQEPISVDSVDIDSEFMEAYRKSMKNISNKPSNYIVQQSAETMSFRSCLSDLRRSGNQQLRLGGIEIPERIFGNIIERIMPNYKTNENCSVANTSVFTAAEMDGLLSSNEITSEEKTTIKNILQQPQFPLALLAVVSQGLCGGGAMEPLLLHKTDALARWGTASFIKDINALTINEYSIQDDGKGGLLCENIIYMPCVVNKGKMGVSKASSAFSMSGGSLNEARDKPCNSSEIPAMIQSSISNEIITTITI